MKWLKSKTVWGVALIVLVVIVVFNMAGKDSPANDAFAKCLTESGAKMYGAYWCPHCKEQKESFGSSWQYVNYIECSLPGGQGQTEVCEQADITGYPTWEFADGERRSGFVSFGQLSALSGCPLSE